MNLVTPWKLTPRATLTPFSSSLEATSFHLSSRHTHDCSSSFRACPTATAPTRAFTSLAKKRDSRPEPVLEPTIVEEVSVDVDDGDEVVFDNFDDDALEDEYDDGSFEDEYLEEDAEVYVGDAGGGGGISLAGTWWDKEALVIAEVVSQSFDGDLKIYSFKTLSNCTIQVRIEKLSKRYGSPSMEDIEAFSATYRARLDEAEAAKSVPENLSLEVSSPGVERVIRVPLDFDRFMDRPMFVKYVAETDTSGSSSEGDGIFKLVSVDMETNCCTWGLADVRANREKAGKGRPLSKKQREWRLTTSFKSLRLVRLYSEV
ncbi:uncharacterized protein LOC115739443 isoform X1 [Rhodamnia argentea]|uniref:Uncharacterized protein LOC115739443 isoform X1 n=1 Tax=Rhodamnia argentea TaxID=178133 RepID=A0A8B8P0Q0_9MYRT|nr:uncharacterized protein LOC115739443 isoform X1 [Rhodamnia argentea]